MNEFLKIPMAFILEMDDVGWDDGRDLRLKGQASRSGLPRHHAVEDYEFLKRLTETTGKRVATALCVGDWDKDNILRGEVGITHDPYGWDRASQIDIEKQRKCLDILENANLDYMVHGVLHGRYDEEGRQITEHEHLVTIVREDGEAERCLESEADFERRLDLFFKIYDSWGMKQKIKAFVTPCGVGNASEATVKRMASVLYKYGVRYWADTFKFPEFDGNLKVYNGVACFKWCRNETKMPWEAYDIDPRTLKTFNGGESDREICLHGSHWTNYLRYNPENNFGSIPKWADFYRRQGEVFGSMNASSLAEAVNQLFYYEYAKLDCGEAEAVIDLSKVLENGLDCHKNVFYLSLKNAVKIRACEGGEVSFYEKHTDFSIYKITHGSDKVKLLF